MNNTDFWFINLKWTRQDHRNHKSIYIRWRLEVWHVRPRQDSLEPKSQMQEEIPKPPVLRSSSLERPGVTVSVCPNNWECLASSIFDPSGIIHTLNALSQPSNYYFFLVLDVFWDEQNVGRGRSQTFDLSELDGTKRWRLEA